MKKKILFASIVLISLFLFSLGRDYVLAAKNAASSQTLKVISNDGETIVYGSVLNPKADEINILLTKKQLAQLRKIGLTNVTVNLTSIYDSTRTYLVPSDAINIQRKAIQKKGGRYLVVSLFNLTSQSGITVSPSALPSDSYKLKITGKSLDTTTDTFDYRTPALIVGTVDSMTAGLVSVESLSGDPLAERTVSTNTNGTFFTEVRANQITSNTKARKHFKAQTTEGETNTDTNDTTTDEFDTGVVHAVTDTDLYAVTPIVNDPESNASRTDKPLTVDESSTLSANLAIESAKEGNEDLALELAQNELDDLSAQDTTEQSFAEEPFDIGCPIDQFADRCSDNEDILASIGADFRDFIQTATCNFPEFSLLKKIIPKLPPEANIFIGKGYCENATREVDEDRPCQIYSMILADFKAGNFVGQLVCPPPFCKEFRGIRPPKCFEPQNFCEAPVPLIAQVCRGPNCAPPPGCFHKPPKDLYCKRIDADIKRDECKDEGFGPRDFGPDWTVVKNSKGNEYCVPSNIPQPPAPPLGIIDYVPPPSTPSEIAEECELNSCHRSCEEKFGFGTPVQIAPIPSVASASTTTASTTRGQFFGGTGPFTPMEPPKCDVCDCHFACDAEAGRAEDCGNPRSKYFSNKCCKRMTFGPGPQPMPPLFNTTLNTNQFAPPSGRPGRGPIGQDIFGCLCENPNNFNEKGYATDDAQNICKNKCPDGYEINPNLEGNCLPICEAGLIRDPGGICRKNCPQGSIADEFGNCSGPANCPQGQRYDPASRQCIPTAPTTCPGNMYPNPNYTQGAASCICPSGLPYWDGNAQQCVAVCSGGVSPSPTTNMPPGSPIPCTRGSTSQCGNSNMIPNNNTRGEAGCICPDGLPYWSGSACVASCPNGPPPSNATVNLPPRSPIPCSSTGSQHYCEAGQIPSRDSCSCASPGYDNGANTPCTCPSGYSIAYSAQGCGSQLRNCAVNEPAANLVCQCAPPATPTGPNGICQCTNGAQYSTTGCGTQTTQCPSPYITNPAYNPSNANGVPPCTCPDATPYTSGTTCVATCPASLVPSTEANGVRTCKCSNGTFPDSQGNCQAQCTGGKIADPQATGGCRCPNNQVDDNGICKCPANSKIDPSNSGNCLTCPGNKVGDSSRATCVCLSGTEQDPNNQDNCRTICNSPKVRDNAGACACPSGTQVDSNNADNCVAITCPSGQALNGSQCCAVCTGNKIFTSTISCACACPQGQTENQSGQCVAQ